MSSRAYDPLEMTLTSPSSWNTERDLELLTWIYDIEIELNEQYGLYVQFGY